MEVIEKEVEEIAEILMLSNSILASIEILKTFAYECYEKGFSDAVSDTLNDATSENITTCEHEWLNNSFDHFGFLQDQICGKCYQKRDVPF